MNEHALPAARESSRHLAELLRREHAALADFLVALSAFDRTGGYRSLGFANVFDYLHGELGLSRGAAHYRKVAARLVARFPEVVEPLRDGRLCLSSVLQLAKVITVANRQEILPRFFHRSREEAKQVAVEIAPATVVPRRTVVTALPEVPAVAVPDLAPVNSGTSPVHPGESSPSRSEHSRTVVEPLTATQSRIHLTVSRELLAKLRKARLGQSHVQPGATDEQVIDAALDLLLAQQEKRRATVPPKVKRAVRKRDGGKCTWPLANGGTCGSEVRTEIDHVVPRGRGGPSTVENCRVLCDVHNARRRGCLRRRGDGRVHEGRTRSARALRLLLRRRRRERHHLAQPRRLLHHEPRRVVHLLLGVEPAQAEADRRVRQVVRHAHRTQHV